MFPMTQQILQRLQSPSTQVAKQHLLACDGAGHGLGDGGVPKPDFDIKMSYSFLQEAHPTV